MKRRKSCCYYKHPTIMATGLEVSITLNSWGFESVKGLTCQWLDEDCQWFWGAQQGAAAQAHWQGQARAKRMSQACWHCWDKLHANILKESWLSRVSCTTILTHILAVVIAILYQWVVSHI
jgi:hypothetical protein